jgi:DNA-binding NarL/FixJ family response regulator
MLSKLLRPHLGAGAYSQMSGVESPKNMTARKPFKNRAKAKILVADCEGVFRLGLKKLFSVEDDLRVVAQAENCLQLVAMAKSFRPNLAIVQQEIALDGCHDLFLQVFRISPGCKVIVTGSKLTDDQREKLFRDGASGVILRSERPEVFVDNVRKVMRGQTIQPPLRENTKKVEISSQDNYRSRPVDTLTRRERTIISCLTQGWRNRDIAQHLTITEQTVKNHLRSVYDKVGVSDRLELVLYAIHQRLELPPVDSSS